MIPPIFPQVAGVIPTVNPTTGPATQPPALAPVPAYNLVEVQAGASFSPGHPSQAQLRFVAHPHQNARLGLTLSGNFSNSPFTATVQVGGRIPLANFMSISLMGEAGIGLLNDDRSQQGRLQEEITRNGIRYFLGGTVQLDANFSQSVGLYFTASALAAINSSLQANPATLRTGEEVNPNEFMLVLGAGIRFGFAPRYVRAPREESAPTPPRETPPQNEPQGPTPEQMQAEFDQRIDELQASFREQIEARAREQVAQAIDTAQTNINGLRNQISRLSQGINEVNRMANTFMTVNDRLSPAVSTLTAEDRTALTQSLDALEHALNTSNSSALDQSIREGLRYIPNSDTSRPRLINTVLNRLITLEASLRARNEGPLADRVARLKAQCERFSTTNTQSNSLQEIQRAVDSTQASLQAIETLVGQQNLGTNPGWTALRSALNEARDSVNLMFRTTQAYNRLNAELSNGGEFFSIVNNPALAQTHFSAARTFIQNMSNQDPTRGVDLAQFNRQFGIFVEVIKYNLNYFIQQHRRPVMSDASQLRQWRGAVQAAHDLACQIDNTSAACRADLGSSPTPPRPPRPTDPRPRHPVAAVCGNGRVESGEVCDDGNTNNGDRCSSDCHTVTTPPRPAQPVPPANPPPVAPVQPAQPQPPRPPTPPVPATTMPPGGTTHRVRLRPQAH